MKTHRVVLAAMIAALVTVASAFASDPTGTWTWTRPGRDGQTVEVTGKLQYADGKLTGTVSGFQGMENAISDGKLDGDQISFKVVMEFNGNGITIVYEGTLTGDAINGKITRPTREGGTRQSDWTATRKAG